MLSTEDEKIIDDYFERKSMNEPKFQWTGQFTKIINGVTLSENHTIRVETREERDAERDYVIKSILPSAKSFPDDEGDVAHEATQEAAQTCSVHKVPMVYRSGVSKKTNKPYAFWSCPEKLPNGDWCSEKGK